ncbi:MAG: TorF family putative porin [Bradyrhizobium sp.]|uniref:TorF family putative porin n=1 Tax=Bradyrhizobium sp. TaxID=376 RepID=UPI001C286842|nr:TorF family putative porin [Bradyrhizobium sp.]MBU6461908.1 TorF family putative porin [Pseudomonadota bacterium]MDE2066885.1 TorF family putative porin [Bradyrhizobium sp.]MDE2241253.1 TorF family putative porin [Bradyrhizobium sp.]
MKKLVLLATALATALAMASGSALAADMPLKAEKAQAPAAFDPWDIAFGAAVMNDYIFRGVTQSNHRPSVTAYFEPRYNVNKDLQFYIGTSTESISFANRAAAEVDVYGGIRPTFGAAAFDFGIWGYLYPGGNCADNLLTGGVPGGNVCPVSAQTIFLADGNVMKRDVSFFEAYAKLNYTFSDNWQAGINEYYTPNFLNSGAWGNYASVTAKYTAPSSVFGTSGVGMYVSGEFGRQWLGTSDAFYGTGAGTVFANGIPYASYDTWNIGIGFTYKVFTLDLRYSDTDLSKGNCNAFTSAFDGTGTTNVTPINPSGVGSNWCGAAGIAKLSVDLTAMTNLK